MSTFGNALREQRWDDHRHYHHSRINQALPLVSAISFVIAYALLFIDPPLAALIAWLVSMTSRQSGHFFSEPKGYDLRRKLVLMAIWAAVPIALALRPDLWGELVPHTDFAAYARNLVLRFTNELTNEIDGFVRQARRKPQP